MQSPRPGPIVGSIDHLVFLYDIACYTVGGIGLMFAALTAALHGNRLDRRYAAFMASFTLIIAMGTAAIYATNAGVQNGLFQILRPYLETAGGCMMIAVLPRFIHCFSSVPAEKTLNLSFAALGVVSYGLGVLWINGVIHGVLTYTVFALIIAVIVYSVTAGNIYSRIWPAREVPRAEAVRWSRIMGLVTVLTVAFIPLFVIIDFYPEIIPSLTRRLPRGFRTYPFFFLLWNLIYMICTLPTYRHQAAGPEKWCFERFDISPREREVVSLLLEGVTYREIAEKLCVSLATVKTHVNRVYGKTGAGNKMELSRMIRVPPQNPV